MKNASKIADATGKLGVLLVGMGAVSTTTIAGVLAVRRGLAKPIGSLTQMGTVRLGKRTDGRSPLIKDFVSLASLDDIVFGGWDIFEDSSYEAAKTAGVLAPDLLEQIRPELEAIRPWPPSSIGTTSSGSTARTSRPARTSAIWRSSCAPTCSASSRSTTSIGW